MDLATARSLSDLTTDFYQRVSASFSATRQTPWAGWGRVLEVVQPSPERRLSVLDLACGNLRFERFLASQGLAADALCVDNCAELMDEGRASLADDHVRIQHLDIAEALFDRPACFSRLLEAPEVDLAVCFGFMHHLAYAPHRQAVVQALLDHVRPGGHAVLTFWQLEHSPRLLAKARTFAGGDEGDYLLGWQGQEGVARYCHSYRESEIDGLCDACASQAHEVTRFSSDGASGDLNRYLVLQRLY